MTKGGAASAGPGQEVPPSQPAAKAGRRAVTARALRGRWGEAWGLIRRRGPTALQFWFIALFLGCAAGLGAIAFRLSVGLLQERIYGTDDPAHLHSFAASLPWYWLVAIPALGGLTVGLLLDRFTEDGRVRSVADVIEGAALTEGRVQKRRGLISTLASMITLSTGGSTGREGPVVHLSSVLATYASGLMRADGRTGRDMLGCAVAAGVSASFNAPIAGALFALEVVLRHFAVHAFAPIVIASAAATVLARSVFGDVTEFVLPVKGQLGFYQELPAFVLLGLVCGCVAVALMRAIFLAEDMAARAQARSGLPRWARPALSGVMLGGIAVWFPHIIGVGYETTSRALVGELALGTAVIFAAVKVLATAITLGGRMGGGVFSPSLMVGALTGLAFGTVATSLFPEASGEGTLYALAGMGAVAAAVLGAPISTTLIVFELTGDWQTGLAVMVAVSISTALASRIVDRSYFLTQLERRGVHLAAGPQAWLLCTLRVESVMRAAGAPRAAPEEEAMARVREGLFLESDATLEQAMPLFEKTAAPWIPVVSFGETADAPPQLWGTLFQVDALRAMNRALARQAAEEHS
ncbi:chloride channel protein [Pseudoroseicyclus aestuarii]|uniref:CIC family chloride channel protein n=1 Tax=Pseudoroseicyclus aestuarii TaxID=1795041 RepID=A0A318ST74_9RHOB|nr:chloride channel protein [Pseudoroseicyclus aestuarii]PYE82512.1 CIC family chloride channel protein [Pseudoroseicyclus aestuarii]